MFNSLQKSKKCEAKNWKHKWGVYWWKRRREGNKRRKEVQGKTFWSAGSSLKCSAMLENGKESCHRQILIFQMCNPVALKHKFKSKSFGRKYLNILYFCLELISIKICYVTQIHIIEIIYTNILLLMHKTWFVGGYKLWLSQVSLLLDCSEYWLSDRVWNEAIFINLVIFADIKGRLSC